MFLQFHTCQVVLHKIIGLQVFIGVSVCPSLLCIRESALRESLMT